MRRGAPAVLSRFWRETLQGAAIRHIKLHAVRHTCATLMHLQGVPVAVIAAWIGHKDASLTMKLYGHSQDDALKAAGATLNRVRIPATVWWRCSFSWEAVLSSPPTNS